MPTCNVQAANAFKPGCIQSNSSATEIVVAAPPKTDQSEDCLYANVYASSNLSGKKPVLVWIYGGAYAVGYADKFYNAVYPQNGIVFVNFDYRVGILGFFSHPGLDAENATHTSGNQGLLDQIAALQWIQKNIAQFGGDPNNVTIEGESAGGGSIGALVTSAAAGGLFKQAFGESVYAQAQPQYTSSTLETYLSSAFPLQSQSIGSLRSLPADSINASAPTDKIMGDGTSNLFDSTNYGPIVDENYQIAQSSALMHAGISNAKNLLVGSCDNEAYAFVVLPTAGTTYPQYDTQVTFDDYLTNQYGALAPQAISNYPISSPANVPDQLAYAFSDTWFNYGTRLLARDTTSQGGSVYQYVYTKSASSAEPASHGCEVSALYPGAYPSTADASDLAFFQSALIQFVKTGNPNGGVVANWLPYGMAGNYLEIGASGNTPKLGYRQSALDTIEQYHQMYLK